MSLTFVNSSSYSLIYSPYLYIQELYRHYLQGQLSFQSSNLKNHFQKRKNVRSQRILLVLGLYLILFLRILWASPKHYSNFKIAQNQSFFKTIMTTYSMFLTASSRQTFSSFYMTLLVSNKFIKGNLSYFILDYVSQLMN